VIATGERTLKKYTVALLFLPIIIFCFSLLSQAMEYNIVDIGFSEKTNGLIDNPIPDPHFLNTDMTFDPLSNPCVIDTQPHNMTVNVKLDTDIIVTFSEAMNTLLTESAFYSVPKIVGNFTWDSYRQNLTLNPNGNLSSKTTYTITITTDAMSDHNVNMISQYSFSFETEKYIPPPEPPLVITSTVPYDNETDIASNAKIYVTFNQYVNIYDTISAFSISPSVKGYIVDIDNNHMKLTFSHSTNFTPGTKYTVTISTKARSYLNVHLNENYSFSFTTVKQPVETGPSTNISLFNLVLMSLAVVTIIIVCLFIHLRSKKRAILDRGIPTSTVSIYSASSGEKPVTLQKSDSLSKGKVPSYTPKEATLAISIKDNIEQPKIQPASDPVHQFDVPSYTHEEAALALSSKVEQPSISLTPHDVDAGVKTENGIKLLVISMIIDFAIIIVSSSSSINIIIPLLIFESFICIAGILMIYLDRMSFALSHTLSVERGIKFYAVGLIGRIAVRIFSGPAIETFIVKRVQSPSFSLGDATPIIVSFDFLWAFSSMFVMISLFYLLNSLMSTENKKVLKISVASAIATFFIFFAIDILFFINIVPQFDRAFYARDIDAMNDILNRYSQISALFGLVGLIADGLLIYTLLLAINDVYNVHFPVPQSEQNKVHDACDYEELNGTDAEDDRNMER